MNSSDSTRFITTLPTASIPSSLERIDSKYIARAMQASELRLLVVGTLPQPDSPIVAARAEKATTRRAKRELRKERIQSAGRRPLLANRRA